MLVVITARTVLKVPFEKAAPPLPFRRSGTPGRMHQRRLTLILRYSQFLSQKLLDLDQNKLKLQVQRIHRLIV